MINGTRTVYIFLNPQDNKKGRDKVVGYQKYLNNSSPTNAATILCNIVGIRGFTQKWQQSPGQEQGRQAVDLKSFSHRFWGEVCQGSRGRQNSGVVDQQVQALVLTYNPLNLK